MAARENLVSESEQRLIGAEAIELAGPVLEDVPREVDWDDEPTRPGWRDEH